MIELKYTNNDVLLELSVLPPSIMAVYNVLQDRTPLCVADIASRTRYSRRTVQEALKVLAQKQMVKRFPNLKDLRKNYYLLQN
ncbi:MAG: MarR family transcriptional regulator [Candidatus Hodarchaeales archaeon]